MIRTLATALVAASLAFGAALPARAQAQVDLDMAPLPVADYTVYVDLPTGFVFVKLPAGWKFAGRVAEQDIARLPAGVVTALLAPQGEVMAASARAEAAIRMR